MKKNLLYSLRRTAYWTLASLDKLLARENSAVILVFHAVDDGNWFFGNSRAQMEAYLKLLSKHYKFISLSQMLDAIEKKQNYMQPVMAVTFDDGYRNIMSIAPLFQELGIKPTVFALSDSKNVNRQELETEHELLNDYELIMLNKTFGWEVGSHTATHENLAKLKPKELQKQIHDSRQKLAKLLDTEVNYFAYPKGGHSEEIVNHVKKAGYKAAFTMDHQEITLLGDLHRIPRIGINRTHSTHEALYSLSPSVLSFKKIMFKIFPRTW